MILNLNNLKSSIAHHPVHWLRGSWGGGGGTDWLKKRKFRNVNLLAWCCQWPVGCYSVSTDHNIAKVVPFHYSAGEERVFVWGSVAKGNTEVLALLLKTR